MVIDEIYEAYSQSGVVSTDTRKITRGCVFFALKGERFNGNKYAEEALDKGAALAIVDEEEYSTNSECILVDDSLKTLQELALKHRRKLAVKILALTGSNGKTTTKELIYSVLKTSFEVQATQGNFNNHIGVPLTLLQLKNETDIGIIEMGANHLGEIEALCHIAEPDYGLITNIGLAHIEGFGSYENIIKAKTELYSFIKANNGLVFINAKNELLKQKVEGIDQYLYSAESNFTETFVKQSSQYLELKWPVEDTSFDISTKLIGQYNKENIEAAVGIGRFFKIKDHKIADSISQYTPGNMRSQFIKTKNNEIILDAYNANPSSMKEALDNFARVNAKSKVIILGEMHELGIESEKRHAEIIERLDEIETDYVFLVGRGFRNFKGKFRCFEYTGELLDHLKLHPIKSSYVLIKGSRGVKLEMVVDIL